MADSEPISTLARTYDPAAVEGEIYERWLAADVFAPDGAGSRALPDAEPFVIVQPPPNVTGALHLGHAFTADIEDVMVRHARMQRPADPLAAGPRPRLDRCPGRARPDPGSGG